MALRVVDIYRPDSDEALELPDDTYDEIGHWSYAIDDEQRVDRVLLEVDETESFLDWLDDTMATEYRVMLQSVEATLPRLEVEDEEEEDEEEDEGVENEEGEDEDDEKEENDVFVDRVGRAELYEYARGAADVSNYYYAMTALSVIVAAGGMLRDQTAVVIGAMVIAPLIGPNLALALGTTLGDPGLLGRAIKANLAGVGVAFLGALGLGVLVPIDPAAGELAARTAIGTVDIALAGAAGAAGALAVTQGGATGLVGVMVAVALLPPLVATGLFLGAGYTWEATQAGLLTLTNLVSLNLAAVCTFLVLGVWPRNWRDVEQARTSTRIALVLWGGAALLLAAIIWWFFG